MNRRRFLAGASLGLLPSAILPQWLQLEEHPDNLVRLSGRAFGTTWQLLLPSSSPIDTAIDTCASSIEIVNAALSPWDAHSEISRFNSANSTDWMTVSRCCSDVIESALHIASQSDGCFDPTVGPIVGQRGFGPINNAHTKPDYSKILAKTNALRKIDSRLTLDPCGIAKGYALDLIVDQLHDKGITSQFLEIGGEVRTSGHHPSGRAWRVGIESPLRIDALPEHYVLVQDKAVATSGVKYNSFGVGSKLVSHIVDPKQKKPVNHSLLSVSVIADTAMLADGWATALIATGGDIALAKAAELDIPSLFMYRTENNTVSTITIAGFEAYLGNLN